MAIFIGGIANNLFNGDPFGPPEVDLMFGNGGLDTLFGGGAADTLFGGDDADELTGGAGNDLLEGGAGGDLLIGGAGIDALSYAQSAGPVMVNLGAGTAAGFDAAGDVFVGFENLFGSGSDDMLGGSAGANLLVGGGGFDVMVGGGGADTLRGGLLADRLTGGAGADVFQFIDTDESNVATGVDVIADFMTVDLIDLSAIDAIVFGADDPFAAPVFGALSGVAGELVYGFVGANTLIEGDVDGDAVADVTIQLFGTFALNAGDFIL